MQEANIVPLRKRSDYIKGMQLWMSTQTGLSQAAKDWLLMTLDGFHDGPSKKPHFPSGTTDKVVVHEITKALTVTKPPSLTAGTQWDLLVISNPFYGGCQTADPSVALNGFLLNTARWAGLGVRTGKYVSVSPAVSGPPVLHAALLIFRVPAGTDISYSSVLTNGTFIGGIDIPRQFIAGDHRVVTEAVEVINTTSQLVVNGSATAFAQPTNISVKRLQMYVDMNTSNADIYKDGVLQINLAGARTYTHVPVRLVSPVVANVAAAQLTQGSLVWHAKFGGYFNSSFAKPPKFQRLKQYAVGAPESDLPPSHGRNPTNMALVNPLYQFATNQNAANMTSGNALYTDTTFATLSTVSYLDPAMVGIGVKHTPRKGLFFTGLHEDSTFQVRVRWNVERKVTLAEADIYTLSEIPPPNDPMLWEVYNRIQAALPVACMVDENPLGEWMYKVAKIMRDYAPRIGTAIGQFVPGAATVGTSLGAIAKVVEAATKKSADQAYEEHNAKRLQHGLIPLPLPSVRNPPKAGKKGHAKKSSAKRGK